MTPAIIQPWILTLSKKAGWGAVYAVTPMSGGANNRVWCVATDGGKALLKVYFSHPDDARDRLGAEFSFLEHAAACGVACVPRPLAMDKKQNAGLYTFIEGAPATSAEVTEDAVLHAVDFFKSINAAPLPPLPAASEACFSLSDHIGHVETRLLLLKEMDTPDATAQAAHAFVNRELLPRWDTLKGSIAVRLSGGNAAAPVCVSPSDFGFHNVIRSGDGKLFFIDFEYAGRDDPAKLVGDFFCQPKVPVPMAFFDRVAATVADTFADPACERMRYEALLPLYQIKWCCIMLGDFLPVVASRRRFANAGVNTDAKKREQLQKARDAFARIRP